jgi:hypothetical protein
MLQKKGDFIFLASVISNSCGWQNVAEIAHFSTVARPVCRAAFRGMRVHQFLASKNKRQLSSKPIGAIRQAKLCLFSSRAMSLPASGTGRRSS